MKKEGGANGVRNKLNYDFVKKQFEKEGYSLLSNEFKHSHSKLDFICPNDHRYSITYGNFRKGARCKYCRFDSKKIGITYIRVAFEEEGYTLISIKYKDSKQKLKFVCSKRHKHSITWSDWRAGHRCVYCGKISAGKKNRGSNNHQWKNYSKEELYKYNNYRWTVYKLSDITYKKYMKFINPLGALRARNEYHLDHKFSGMEGITNKINPKIISNPYNLQMLLEKENIAKFNKSSISIDELLIGYELCKLYEELGE